ncbi:unnamed protein product [Nyctereutes procyonoides]|uniref:(raccoon dog) hypothetical protein n=1 Tax=Nyctereutes procyonoides TaxID=34880 RepID=A0A811YP80_NYCPR|nr:unnamed protein product [Nyctereutes procyonoides]
MLRSGFSWRPAAAEGRNLRPGRSLSPSSGRDPGRRRGAAGGGSGPPRKPDPKGAWGTDEAEERRPEGSRATLVFSDSTPSPVSSLPFPKTTFSSGVRQARPDADLAPAGAGSCGARGGLEGLRPPSAPQVSAGGPALFRPAVLSTSPGRALGLEANTERLHEFTEKYLDDSDLGTTTEPKPR